MGKVRDPNVEMVALNDIIILFARFGVDVPRGTFDTMADLRDAIRVAVDKVKMEILPSRTARAET